MTAMKLLCQIVNGTYDPVSERYSGLLRQVVKKLLSTQPEMRPDIVQV